MGATRQADILRHLEGAVASDGELLTRFASSRDPGAFEELVRRHGALVLGVCRRVTGHPQDAEDAFQAVFLVLTRKAGAVRVTGALGNWLYGVAYRVALRARRAAGRRKAREVTMSSPPEIAGPTSPVPSELLPLLDEELAALPLHYRDAIVLCDLQGASREDAAAALGVPEGTLSSRLANGRKKLAARLTKRGVVLSIAVLPLALADVRGATVVSKELVLCTGALVADVAAGGAVPRAVAHLLNGESAVRKMLIVSAVLVVTAVGAVMAAHPGAEPPQKGPPKPPAVAEKAVQPLETKEQPKPSLDKAVTFTTAPNLVRATDLRLSHVRAAFWNATGTHLAVLGSQPTDPVGLAVHGGQPPGPTVVAICEIGESRPFVAAIHDKEEFVGFGADGKSCVTALREYHLISGRHELKFWAVADRVPNGGGGGPGADPRELKLVRTVKIDAAETHTYAFTPDLKSYRTVAVERSSAGEVSKLGALLVDTTTGKSRSLLTPAFRGAYALSDNGKRLAVLNTEATQVAVYDLDRGVNLFTHTFKFESDPLLPVSGKPARVRHA